jgi:hypothetical protein
VRRVLVGSIAGFVSLIVMPARAADASPRWVYSAPAGCPTSSEVDDALRERIPATAVGTDPRTFVIEVRRTGSSFEGRLTFSDDVGERVVQEPTCTAVVQALIVFTAVALDPSGAPESPEPQRVEPPATPPRTTRSPAAEPEKATPTARRPARLGFGAGAGVTSGPVPAPSPLFAVNASIHQPFGNDRGLGARLGVKATSGEKDVSRGRLDTYLVAAHAEVGSTIDWRSLTFGLGPALTVGALSATGQDLDAARKSTALWVDIGAILRAGVRTGGLRFEVYGAMAAALTPRTYMLQRPVGERVVHETPPFLLTIGGEIVIELGRGL